MHSSYSVRLHGIESRTLGMAPSQQIRGLVDLAKSSGASRCQIGDAKSDCVTVTSPEIPAGHCPPP